MGAQRGRPILGGKTGGKGRTAEPPSARRVGPAKARGYHTPQGGVECAARRPPHDPPGWGPGAARQCGPGFPTLASKPRVPPRAAAGLGEISPLAKRRRHPGFGQKGQHGRQRTELSRNLGRRPARWMQDDAETSCVPVCARNRRANCAPRPRSHEVPVERECVDRRPAKVESAVGISISSDSTRQHQWALSALGNVGRRSGDSTSQRTHGLWPRQQRGKSE
jgi:hypothetical protein